MIRLIAALAAMLLLAACTDDTTYACSPCGTPRSIATIELAAAPIGPVHAEVCVEGGECYHLRTAIPGAYQHRAHCWADTPPASSGWRTACLAADTEDGWAISLPVPEPLDGRTATARWTTSGFPYQAQAAGVLQPADHGRCACGPNTIAAIHLG